ncbi:MAG TPA: methyltransferase domain-containing protein [Thermoanaerobaculia bacterium]|jgi:ubiquinone/menaquinone biosynthesis C-methylase UbiE|nr:methyltransferase domain-containing protein [Thermoanaerobaculia bacterium]
MSRGGRIFARWSTRAWILILLAIACGAPLPAGCKSTPPAPKRQPANVMSFEGASWLEREGRAEAERPEVVLAAMELREGMTVAEIGAGTGFFSRRLAKAVGPQGKVLAVDIQPEMLDLLRTYAAKEGITNIVPILGTETDPKLPAHGVDRVLLVDVYHEFQKPQPMLAHIRDSLAPGGTVTLVEYRLEDDTASHINIRHRMSVEQVLAEWNAAGFELLNQLETLPSQHLFLFSARRGARPR